MAGNRQIYEQAMNMGHSTAWDQQWDKAIAAYGRAIQEFPEDPAAHNSLGLALLQARRLEDALKVYTRAHQLAPDDPIPLEKSADILERMGRLKEAAQQYINVAEVYLAQRDLEKAIGNWERATRLTAGLVQIHQRLALAYERTGQRRSAIREYLTLAFNFQRANRTDIAMQAVERALRLEPTNPQALNTMTALQTGALISADIIAGEEDQPQETQREKPFAPSSGDEGDRRDPGEADPRGPIGEAVETALASLATYVFESGSLDAGGTYAIQGIELQRQGDYKAAADVYDRAISSNMRHPAVYFNLGIMLLELEDWKHAIKNLEKASEDQSLVAGAMHGLSLAYATMKNHRQAAQHLIHTLRMVDLGLAMSPDEAGQLAATYDQLGASIGQADESQLRRMNEQFLELLTGPSWKQRVAKTRRQLEEAVRQEDPESLISMVPYINDRVTEGLNLVDQYMRRGLYNLAMDHAHFMLETAPDYLPIHQRIGQILLERDNVSAAMAKYNLVANTYVVRGDEQRGAEILQEALKIAPMDVGLHKSLIALLEKAENWEQVLHQQIDLADTYYQLAAYDEARTTYSVALQLAQRTEASKESVIQILHRIGDIDVSRLDMRQAMRTYEQIRKLDPEDERARRALVDLNYKLNDTVSAIRELDGLLRLYAKQRRANKIIQILDEHVTRYPNDMALRSRLAAVYQQTGMPEKSIEQLDHLAELQLQSGLHNDALVTVRRIIELNPTNVQDYQRLLRQLNGTGG